MPITYNLKYKKVNYLGRLVMEKEGEIVFEDEAFRLKGKGGNDQGELIRLVDVKDIFVKGDILTFITIAKEKYYLSHLKNLFNDFVIDFMRLRNKFILDALFLERGDVEKEYDAQFHYVSQFGKTISKGDGQIRLYDKSIVVIPQTREAFSIPFDFIASQDVDEINYEISLTFDNGKKLIFNHLNTMFEEFYESMDRMREKMYQDVVNGLRSELPEFDVATILKLAAEMKGGKATPVKKIKKIDAELWEKFSEVLLPTDDAKAVFELLSGMAEEDNVYAGYNYRANAPEGEREYNAWTLFSMPEKNMIAMQMTSRDQVNTHFFQIIMEQGDPFTKDKERIQEINQTMITFDFDTQVFSRERKDLKKGKYRLVLAKIPFLRSLRKSYLGRAYYKTKEDWMKYFEITSKKADLSGRRAGGRRSRGER